MSYRLVSPAIRWGTNYANAAYFGFPLDNVTSWSEPGSESEYLQYIAGVEDAWIPRTDQVLEGDLRWIPGSDTLFYPRCTGWDFNAATPGVRQMLEWVKAKNLFAWHPDGRNLVRHSGLLVAGDAQSGMAGSSTLIYSQWVGGKDGSPTAPDAQFDAGTGAWKVLATGATGSSDVQLSQRFPCIPGEMFTLSADYKASGLAVGASVNLNVLIYAADGTTLLQTHSVVTGLTATSFTRASVTGGTVTPANAVYAQANLRLDLPNGASGTVWFKNAMVRRDSTDTTFIDNPSIDAYWVDPAVVPTWEPDGQRKLHLKIRDQTLGFEAY